MATITESERAKIQGQDYSAEEKEKILNASFDPLFIENNDSSPKEIDQNVEEVRKTPGLGDEECNRCKNQLPEEEKEKKVELTYRSAEMDLEEYRTYLKQVRESEGFDVERFTKLGSRIGIISPFLCPARKKHMPSCCEEAIQVYNIQEKTNYKFHEVVKATAQICSGTMYFITFKAIDPSDQTCVIFQAKVWRKVANQGLVVKFCRKKATQ